MFRSVAKVSIKDNSVQKDISKESLYIIVITSEDVFNDFKEPDEGEKLVKVRAARCH